MFSRLDEAVADVDAASRALEIAEQKYRKGGGVDPVNKARARLAAAHEDYRCVSDGRIPTDRR